MGAMAQDDVCIVYNVNNINYLPWLCVCEYVSVYTLKKWVVKGKKCRNLEGVGRVARVWLNETKLKGEMAKRQKAIIFMWVRFSQCQIL